jgi:photosystem II stability/assembly factor-like uncharacterized protein
MEKTVTSSTDMLFAQSAVGAASANGRTWFIAEEEDLFRVIQYKEQSWLARTPDWPIVSICGDEKKDGSFEVIALGIEGELLIGMPGEFSEAELQKEAAVPFAIGPMRDIRFVGDDVFAAGMSRQVFRRTSGVWNLISTDIHSEKGSLAGFNSIHGVSPSAVYAVGFEGEIWFYNGEAWKQLSSPTSVVLNRVVAAPNGFAIICGAAGLVLQANSDQAVTVKNDVTQDNLYGLTIFKGKVFVSSLTALFELTPDGLQAVDVALDFGSEGPLTFGHLEANEKTMWSVGANHLLRTDDGVTWELVVCGI